MTSRDDDLLARLNALKPSSVQLNGKKLDLTPSGTGEDAEDLTARFQKLHGGASRGLSAEPESLAPHNDEDDQTLENLLADLGPEEQWKLDPDEPAHINALLDEAKAALLKDDTAAAAANVEPTADDDKEESTNTQTAPFAAFEARLRAEDRDEDGIQDARDEKDADDYIAKVLAALAVEGPRVDNEEQEDGDEDKDTRVGTAGELDLPSAPTLEPPSTPRTQAALALDEALTARFASLGLGLPAAPSFSPSRKPPTITSKVKKRGPGGFTDDDIESWCCICNDDATVRCLGCDGDLYCTTCWKEGHGNGPGQERGHRATEYRRDLGAAAA